MSYQIIDYISKKYAVGGLDSKRYAEKLNKELKNAGLQELSIIPILSEKKEKPNPVFKDVGSVQLIGIEVGKRIAEKMENDK